jgi:hypothetical protein
MRAVKRSWIAGLGCAALLAALTAPAARAQQTVPPPPNPNGGAAASDNGASLEDTIGFIRDKINEQNVGQKVTSDPNSCTFTFEDRPEDPETLGVGVPKDIYTVVSVNLKDIIKAEITDETISGTGHTNILLHAKGDLFRTHTIISDKGRKLYAKTTGQKNPVWPDEMKDSWVFNFREDSMADRVAKAIIHAVELCTPPQKPEPF